MVDAIKQVAGRSGLVAFSPRARLLKLIGSELISDDVVAITELVKNAHDADASQVSIQFVGVTSGDGEILIRDDGCGMSVNTLLTRWMQPAGSSKGRGENALTAKGRRVLGEKGVGRFAADKLAASLELVSRPLGEPSEVRAVFNWNEFDHDEQMLADVTSHWECRPAEWLDSSGTVLRLTALRSRWNERLFRRLSTRLARLVSPFERGSGFRIIIESDEFPEYTGEVAGGFLDQAPYSGEAEFDGKGMLTVRLNGGRVTRQEWSDGSLACGPVRARIFAFDLEQDSLARVGPRGEVRAWLREWSGVSVYRDGFRVWPYGEPHDDWLRLDQRRVNNPVVRLSNNQVVGFIEISRDRNPHLRDQTNREGLIHNEAFADLQRLILFAMQLLEAERQSIRHPSDRARVGHSPDAGAPGRSIASMLEQVLPRVEQPVAQTLRKIATQARSQAEMQGSLSQRMLAGYSELAARGQMAGTLGRCFEIELTALKARCADLRRGAREGQSMTQAALVAIDDLEVRIHLLCDRATQLDSTVDATRRRAMDVPAELARIRAAVLPLLRQYGGDMTLETETGNVLRVEMRPEAFLSLSCALVSNAVEWRPERRPLRITITARCAGEKIEVLFADNGRGVLEALQETLFEPMVSGREGGPGMGLALARNIITTHGGTIELVTDRRRRGATFRILLPRKRTRATPAGH